MKQDNSLDKQEKEVLSDQIVMRKWNSLRKEFKRHYYNSFSNPEEVIHFQFYDTMLNIFEDYATEKLNSNNVSFSDKTMNKSYGANVTAFVMNMLDSDNDGSFGCNEKFSSISPKPSREVQVRQKLARMPKESLSIHETKMRIVPNTPFNSRCQLSTIFNYNKPQPLKRRNIEDDFKTFVKKRQSSFEEPAQDITIIDSNNDSSRLISQKRLKFNSVQSTDVTLIDTDETLTEVEALNECNFSSEYFFDATKDATMETIEDSTQRLGQSVVEPTTEAEEIEQPNYSVLDVPSYIEGSVEELRAVKNNRQVSIMSWSNETQNVSTSSVTSRDIAPSWFQSFLKQYNADMQRLESKIVSIDTKLNKILTRNSLPVSIPHHRFKREF